MPHPQAVRIYKSRLAAAAARRGTADDSRVTFGLLAEEYVKVYCPRKSETATKQTNQALRIILPVWVIGSSAFSSRSISNATGRCGSLGE